MCPVFPEATDDPPRQTQDPVWAVVVSTHQQLSELHQLVVSGSTGGSAADLPDLGTRASCQPQSMTLYSPQVIYPSVRILCPELMIT